MTKFRPCIDLHAGSVKQIVGGTLDHTTPSSLQTNHVSAHPAGHFASLYRKHNLTGGHVIMLGPGNEDAAREALAAWPGGLQVGGGIGEGNAREWIEAGAEQVIVTSYLFPHGMFSEERLEGVLRALGGDRGKLVIDLSCRRKGESWFVATDKWRTVTDFEINEKNLSHLSTHCSSFLIHAADAEGLQSGVDSALVATLSRINPIPVTYAGGARNLADLQLVKELSSGRVDVTIGSALDVFGGQGVTLDECVAWNRAAAKEEEEKGRREEPLGPGH